jgi:hypothetical protein
MSQWNDICLIVHSTYRTDGQSVDLTTPSPGPTELTNRSTNARSNDEYKSKEKAMTKALFTTSWLYDPFCRSHFPSIIATRRRNRWSHHPYAWTLTTINFVFACLLGALHVCAEQQQPIHDDTNADTWSVWIRLSSGPVYWTPMDKIFFWSLILIALEILNYLCGKSGGESDFHFCFLRVLYQSTPFFAKIP